MTIETNRAAMLGYIQNCCTGGDASRLGQYIHTDVVLPPDMPEGRQGLCGLQEHVAYMTSVFEYTYEVGQVVAEGDLVAARLTINGKQLGEFMGKPARGNRFAIEEWNIAQLRDGKISEIWRIADFHGLLAQLAADS